jgi:hypothetical protein
MSQTQRERICLFIGPSLAGADLEHVCSQIDADVVLMPPVQQGDLLRLRELEPTIVAIVDGAFYQVPSVSHKEILLTLERGVRVLGASSLGALRAAELDVFGVQGVGEIYRLYKRGVIDGDDEVALVHGQADEGYRGFSEPLVNIRHNLTAARSRGIISPATAATVLSYARGLHFTRRTYAACLDATKGHVPADELARLAVFLRDNAIDLKRADALELVRVLADRPTRPRIEPVKTHRTVYLHLFEREYVGRTTNGRYLPDAQVLSFFKLLSPEAPRLHRRMLLRSLALDEATHRGLRCPDPNALVAEFRRQEQLQPAATFQRWLDEQCLWPEELVAVLRERYLEHEVLMKSTPRKLLASVAARTGVCTRRLLSGPRMRPGIPWDGLPLREAKLSAAFRATQEQVRQILDVAEQTAVQMPGYVESLACSRLEAWFARRWNTSEARMGRALRRRGFVSYREFIDVARLAYVYERVGGTSVTPLRSRAAVAL